jgi:hypothetical protein
MREEGAAETNFEFQLFERAPNQGTHKILQTVGHEKNLLEMFDALGVKKLGRGRPMPSTCLGMKRRASGKDWLRPMVGRHSRTGDMIW